MAEEAIERHAAEKVLDDLDADEYGRLGGNDAARVQTDLALGPPAREETEERNRAQRDPDDAQKGEEALADIEPGCPGVVTEPRSEAVTKREAERQKPQQRSLGPGHGPDRKQSRIKRSDGSRPGSR